MTSYDIIIIGGGPTGLACGIEAQKAGLSFVILEQGAITDAIRRFPVNMTFFSTPELLELDNIPFTTINMRPSRVEALQYYRQVVEYRSLNLRLYTKVTTVQKDGDWFKVGLHNGETCQARSVIFATGYFDNTNKLGIPGENLPHVSHYYDEPYRYARTRVAIIGGRNSAVETALDLYRHGASVILIHRQPTLGDSVKYWVRPDIENRIKNGGIATHFSTVVEEITPSELRVRNTTDETRTSIAADFVFAMIGHRPDESLLRSAGVEMHPQTLVPSYHPDTFETNVEGLYVAGSVACGCETWNIFIENGRAHAQPVISHILATKGQATV